MMVSASSDDPMCIKKSIRFELYEAVTEMRHSLPWFQTARQV